MPELHFEVLPQAQQRVWHILTEFSEPLRSGGFYLAGGTALALHLGHRQSVDFDFFSQQRGTIPAAMEWLERVPAFTLRDSDPHTMHGNIAEVKLSIIGGYRYPLLEPALDVEGILLARPLDIGVMKLLAITHRATIRDYLDLAALLRAGWDLSTLLEASSRKYGSSFCSAAIRTPL